MRAVAIQEFGDPQGMRVVEVADPTIDSGHLLLKVEAIGVGGVDAVIRRGTLGSHGFKEGLIPGSEVAGEVIAVGSDLDPSWVGQKVWAFTGTSGGYAELAVAAFDDVSPLPAGLSTIDAVTLGSAGPVAHFGLQHAQLAAGQSVLIRGAAGSIGITAVQLAVAGGAARVAVTTRTEERGERLRLLGATEILGRDGEHSDGSDVGPFDILFDVVAGEAMPSFLDLLAANGRAVAVGVVAGYPPTDFGMSLMRHFQRSLSFSTFSVNTVPIPARNQVRADIFALAARGDVRAVVHDVLKLSDAANAHRLMDAGEVFGRIVLTP